MKLRPAVVALAVALAATGCKQPPMTEFKSPDGKFSIKFPGTPKESTHAAAGMTLKMYLVETWRGDGYMLGYADAPLPPGESATKLHSRLDDGRTGALRAVDATMTSSKAITLSGGHPGQEFTGQGSGRYLRARIYIVGIRLYQLVVAGRTESFTTSKEADEFFDSFQLVGGSGNDGSIPIIPDTPGAEPELPSRVRSVGISSTNGKFKARFPADPKKGSQPAGGVTFTTYTAGDGDGSATAGYADLPETEGEPAKKRSEWLDEVRDGLVASAGGKLKDCQLVTLAGKHRGWEFTATGEKHLRGRVYLVGNRVYQVTVRGSEAYTTSKPADAFLDSFQVTN